MARLTASPETIARNLAAIRSRVGAACARSGRDVDAVRICVATKYVDAGGLDDLRAAGVKIAAENRLQDMIAKQSEFGEDFEWHFIGAIQSKKIRDIAGRVSMIHSLSTDSARDKLADLETPAPAVLVQVNVAREQSKAGVDPDQLDEFLAACPVPISGLMTMPPIAENPEDARPHFRALAKLASERGLGELSMGTTQDFEIAVEEGATLIRVGSALFADA